jgi:DNA-binding NarL/FixJ family response regulator
VGKKRILVVDDSEAVREAVGLLLRDQADLEVCGEAVDGVDAIEKTKTLNPDLILLDLAMPKLNGAAAASILKGATPGTPIILFTMYEEAVHALAPAIGVDVVLAKPDGFSRLLERIRELLGEQPNNAATDSIKAHDKGTAASSADQN